MGEFPDLKKIIVIVAPHTSNWDIIIEKLYMKEIGIKNRVLTKKELFFFPMNLILKAWGAIPIDRNDIYNTIINDMVTLFKENRKFCLIMTPEGTRKKVTRWKKGFLYIARKAQVPIVISYIDFKKKEVGIKGVIKDTSDKKEIMKKINKMFKNVNAKYPKDFILDKRYS